MASRTISVNDSKELKTAVERLAASGGGTIRLEASDKPYTLDLTDRARSQTDAPVRITSADPDDPAVIAKLRLVGRENVSVDGVVFDSSEIRRDTHHRDLEITDSDGVTITDNVFRGDATETLLGQGEHRGVTMALVRLSEDVTLSDNLVSGYFQGMSFHDSEDVVVAGNEVTALQGDAIRIAGVQDMLVEDNHLHDMLGAAKNITHTDMIQFWGTNTRQNTERVTIRENVILTGEGPAYQMIFGHNEERAKNGWRFEDIVIEGNVLHGAQQNMIAIAHTRDMVVRDNTVLWNEDTVRLLEKGKAAPGVNGWIRADPDTVVAGNLASNIEGPSGRNGIVTYRDPSKASHFSNNFVNLEAHGSAELQDLGLLPGSQWDRKMGSPLTWSSHRVETITPTVDVEFAGGDRSVVTLDAGLTRDAGGRLGTQGVEYLWTFEDGTRARGQTVTHDFESAGTHGYALEVRSDGRSASVERTLEIEDPALLRIEMDKDGVRDVSSYESRLKVTGGKVVGDGFVLDGKSQIELDRSSDQIYSLDHFALTMTFQPAKAGASGVLFVLPEAMQGSIRADGSFAFKMTTTQGTAVATTEPGAFSGTRAHELAVIYDDRAITIYIDGEEAGSAPLAGLTKPLEHWGLVIGNPWNPSVKGTVSDIALSAELEEIDPDMAEELVPVVPNEGGGAAGREGDEDGAPIDEPGDQPAEPRGDAPLIQLGLDGDVRDAAGDAVIEWDRDAVRFDADPDGGRSVALGDKSDGVTISRANAELFERDAFTIAFDLKRAPGDEGGHVVSLPRTLDLSIEDDGGLRFTLVTDEGRAVAVSEAPVLADAAWHAVELAYDADEGAMQVVVDGVVAAEASQSGTTGEAKHWGLTLGQPWGGEADGLIDDFRFYGGAELRDAPPPAGPSGQTGDGVLLALDFEGSLADAGGRPVELAATGDVPYVAGAQGRAAWIGETSIEIGRSNAFLHGREAFGIGLDLKRDGAGADGYVLRLKDAFEGWVTEDGAFVFELETDEGRFRVETADGALGTGWSRVEIGYDDAADRLQITVDGQSVETRASGATPEASHWGLSLGSPWGHGFEGAIDGFVMSDAPDWA